MGKSRRWAGILAATVALGFLGAACAGAPPAQCGMDPTSAAIFNDVNVARAQNGLPGLAPNGQLTCLAQGWSAYMAATNSFVHRNLAAVLASPGYGGYHTLGENILEGPAGLSADQIHTAWMNSPDHRANILDGAYSSLGVGLAYANGQVWATEDFGG